MANKVFVLCMIRLGILSVGCVTTFQRLLAFLSRCFIPNAYGALASVLGPVLLFLLAVGVVTTQAYQVTLQWKLYDDIFRGHHNIKGR